MMNFLEANVAIKVDDSKLPAQLAKARSIVTRSVDKIKAAFNRMATSFKAAFDKMVRYAKYGALAIAGALVLVTRAAIKQEDVLERLNIVLKSTGYAAGLTRKELVAHAQALQKVTVYGDETIEAMQALLLTFKGIKGEVFMRTTEAILDLSKAMGQDLQQSVIQVGKAINDPILGITALRRVGIQFTKDQEEMIRTLVESGKLFKAQGIILTELESQFGGMSRMVDTAGGRLKQMWNVLGDVAEKIGAAFIPGIKSSAIAIKEWAEKNQEKIGRWAEIWVDRLGIVIDKIWDWVNILTTEPKKALSIMKDELIIFFAALVDTFLIAGLAAGKAFWRGVGFGKPSAREMHERWIEEGGPGGYMSPELRERLSREIMVEKLREEVKVVEQLKVVWKGAAEAMSKAIPETRKFPTAAPWIGPPGEAEGAKIDPIIQIEARFRAYEKGLADYRADLELTKGTAGEFTESVLQDWDKMTERVQWYAQEFERTMAEGDIAWATWSETVAKADEETWGELRRYAQDATNLWKSFGRVVTGVFDDLSRNMAEMLAKGKVDWRAFGRAVCFELTVMMIRAMMLRAVMAFFPGLAGPAPAPAPVYLVPAPAPIPGGQYGGVVERTGLAKIHRGEVLSGVNNEQGLGNTIVNISDYAGVDIEVREYMQSDQRIVDVSLEHAAGDGTYRRAHEIG